MTAMTGSSIGFGSASPGFTTGEKIPDQEELEPIAQIDYSEIHIDKDWQAEEADKKILEANPKEILDKVDPKKKEKLKEKLKTIEGVANGTINEEPQQDQTKKPRWKFFNSMFGVKKLEKDCRDFTITGQSS